MFSHMTVPSTRRTENQNVDVGDSAVGAVAEKACRPGSVAELGPRLDG